MKTALVLVCVCACDWSLHRMQDQPRCTTHGELDDELCDLAPPEHIVALGDVGDLERPPLTRGLFDRGRDRFGKLCAPCHGIAGDGDSDVARAMTLRRPPSLLSDRVRAFEDTRIFGVITNGYGMMPSYSSAITVGDRWAIIAYVRALEAREVPASEVPPEVMAWLR